ncbi:alpha/beta hydrolase [bacterium]|jgi:uncharacterized protein|nr:alpha/beta hydrolase [Planctomicrobium sp.]MDA7527630.1 alpha/beta hydrolase [bacterium]
MNEPPEISQKAKQSLVRRMLLDILIFVSATYLCVCLMLFFLQKNLIYVPRKSPVSIEESGYQTDRIREVSLEVDKDINLLGWYCTAEANDTSKSNRLAIIFPGNGGNRLNRVKLLQLMNSLGCDALIFDYRSYGGSEGSPSEDTMATDSHRIWNFAQEELGYDQQQIIILGQSLGGGVSTRLVSDLCEQGEPPAGFILQATFTSLVDAAKHRYPWLPINLLLTERYPSIDRIPNVTCPLLFVHGQKDKIVPFKMGQQLFAAAPETSENGIAKKFIELPEAGHNDIMYVALAEITKAKRQFLAEIDRTNKEVE